MKASLIIFFHLASLILVGQNIDLTIHAHDITYNIQDEKNATIEEYYELTVHNEEGYKNALDSDYYDKFRKVSKIEMIVKSPEGKKVKKLIKSDAADISFSSSYELVDTRMLFLSPNYQNYPFKIEVKKEIKLNGFISFPEWIPQNMFNQKVESAKLTIISPVSFKIKSLSSNISSGNEKRVKEGNNMIYTWNVENLPAQKSNISYKTFYEKQPRVRFTPVSFKLDGHQGSYYSWGAFGNWYLNLNENRDELEESTMQFIDQLDKSDKKKLVNEIYQYMQDRTIYISIQLGIGGFQTIPSDEVEKTGYGDCKALSNYMKSMLNYAGVPSNYILVRAGSDVPDVIASFPSNQFNHVFLGVPLSKDTLFLECTSQTLPSNYIGTFTDDRNVLWIEKDNSQIIRSKIYSEKDNLILSKANVNFLSNGNANIQIEASSSGVFYGKSMKLESMSEQEIKTHIHKDFSYKDFSIKSFNYELQKDQATLSTTTHIETRNLARQVAGKFLLPVNVLEPADKLLDFNRYTKYAEVKRAFMLRDEVVINLPENYSVPQMPTSQELETEFGSYSISVARNDDGSIQVSRKLYFKKGKYDNDKFLPFKTYLDKINRFDKRNIIIDSKT